MSRRAKCIQILISEIKPGVTVFGGLTIVFLGPLKIKIFKGLQNILEY